MSNSRVFENSLSLRHYKIIFICGGLQEGKDGVGDYTRRLAGELISNGHNVAVISLNDKNVSDIVNGFQNSSNIDIPVLRIPQALYIIEKFKIVNDFISHFEPDWISLQYVPFSFQTKGLTFKLGPFLKRIGTNAKWHLMVHELCVGIDKGASVKLKIWGRFQKMAFRRLVKKLQPSIIHTHIKLYYRIIENLGFHLHILPLFSNIPSFNLVSYEPKTKLKDKTVILGIYFGSAPKPTLHKVLAEKIGAFGKTSLCRVRIVFCGKSGASGKLLWNELKYIDNVNIEFEILGELSISDLSNLLLKADFGIAQNSSKYIGKSGSSLAMLEHGLPIWIPFADEDDGVVEHEFREHMCYKSLEDLFRNAQKMPVVNRLPKIAEILLAELNSID